MAAVVCPMLVPFVAGAESLGHLQALNHAAHHRVHATVLDRPFHVFVRLPEGYEASDRAYPTLYLLSLRTSSTEGRAKARFHLYRERDPRLVESKKADVLGYAGRLACEVCGFDFALRYGDRGSGFCEVHHRTPLSELTGATETTLDDLVIVCSNCHRMLHRRDPWLSVEELGRIIRQQKR